MAADVDIDWSQLDRPDPVGDYAGAFEAGRRLATPAGPVATGGGAIGDGTDIQSHIAQMSEQQRQAASQTQEQFAAILNGLKLQTVDVNQRLAMARHFAALQPQFGIDPRTITPDDVTDQGIASHVAAAMSLKARLDASNRQSQLTGPPDPAAAMARERGAFYQRASQMGMSVRDIESQWKTYARMHFPQAFAPVAGNQIPPTPSSSGYTILGVE